LGRTSTSGNIANPDVVQAAILSKNPSIIDPPIEFTPKNKNIEPIKLAHNHVKEEIIIPCFKFIL
jgi:hypothetical protein